MKIDQVNEEKELIKNAYETLKKEGVSYGEMVELYSMKVGDFLLGVYTGESRVIETQYGDRKYYIFDVKKASLTGKGGNRKVIENQKCGIFATKTLSKLIETELRQNGDKWERVGVDRKGQKLAIIFKGYDEVKLGKRTVKVAKYDFRVVS